MSPRKFLFATIAIASAAFATPALASDTAQALSPGAKGEPCHDTRRCCNCKSAAPQDEPSVRKVDREQSPAVEEDPGNLKESWRGSTPRRPLGIH